VRRLWSKLVGVLHLLQGSSRGTGEVSHVS
jgi:hypothetical protein